MDLDPMEYVENDDDDEEQSAEERREERVAEKRKSRLNTIVAVTVALLATFMGVCKVKDDNIVQAMQQEQAKSIDTWAWYQAKKTRLEVAQIAATQLRLQAQTAPPTAQPAYKKEIALQMAAADKESKELKDTQKEAKAHDDQYDAFNYHDDQFDLSDALMSISIALLAMTSLTQKRWLFAVAMVPTFFGVLMGLAGLFSWHIHSDYMAKLLGT